MKKYSQPELDNMLLEYRRTGLMALEYFVSGPDTVRCCGGSRAEAAKRLGVAGQVISRWLAGTGSRNVYHDTWQRLIACGVDPGSIGRIWSARCGRPGSVGRWGMATANELARELVEKQNTELWP